MDANSYLAITDSIQRSIDSLRSSTRITRNSTIPPFVEAQGHYYPDHQIYFSGKFIRSFEIDSNLDDIRINITTNPDYVGSDSIATHSVISRDTLVFTCPLNQLGTLIFTGYFTKWNKDGSSTRITNSNLFFPHYLEGLVRIEKDNIIVYSEYHHFSHVGQETGE
jgi:hypothetical protein